MSQLNEEDNLESTSRLSFFIDPNNWPLFYHTGENMKARQLIGIAERKLRHVIIPRLPIDFDQRYEEQIPNKLVVTPQSIAGNSNLLRNSLSESERENYRNLIADASEGKITFLNRSIEFDGDIDWDHDLLDEYPLLWRLKLQSFEFLEWAVLGFEDPSGAGRVHEQFQRWLLSWTTDNPIGEQKYLRRSWIPHSVSLRILNWSRYAAWCEQANILVDDRLYRQIYKNTLFLENHIEFDVGGNHLIENAIALVVAGALFENHSTEWTKKGLDLLDHASKTQFLADGGHFERSPMYHLMVLRRYVTASNLLSSTDYSTLQIETTAKKGLGFLEEISKPNNKIPLLNDSVRGEQIKADSCITYGELCNLHGVTTMLDGPDGSGYSKLIANNSTLLIDVGDVGPPHLPAHSHNDQLSVYLWIDGVPILTDTGVYDYAPTPLRQYSRSVSAHNTAQYQNKEPISIGGSYLMGRRTTIEVHKQGANRIQAECSRQSQVGIDYKHIRDISTAEGKWIITDLITSGDDDGEYTVRYHFSPVVDVHETTKSGSSYSINNQNTEIGRITVSGDTTVKISESQYFERYGQKHSRQMITATSSVGNKIVTHITTKTGSF